jgi:PPOX class probable F420-dependent enzyme
MTTNTAIDALGSAKYISVTTFRKDGTPVATPVWLVRDGASLMVITDPTSGKAKRLRNNPAVLVSPCDMRREPSRCRGP